MPANTVADADFPLVHLEVFTVATVPPAADWKNRLIIVTNGSTGALGLALSDGTNWLRIVVGAAIAAS